MAALRCAARTLCTRALHRTPAVAVAEVQRPLLPRLSDTQHPSGKRPASPHVERMYAMEEIQMKKEELYNLIAAENAKYMSKLRNTQLLQHLSVHIKPRPNDPYWRRLRTTKRLNDFVEITGVIVSGALCASLFHSGNEADPTGKKTDLVGNEREQ